MIKPLGPETVKIHVTLNVAVIFFTMLLGQEKHLAVLSSKQLGRNIHSKLNACYGLGTVWACLPKIHELELGLQDSSVEVVGSSRRGTLWKVLGHRGTILRRNSWWSYGGSKFSKTTGCHNEEALHVWTHLTWPLSFLAPRNPHHRLSR